MKQTKASKRGTIATILFSIKYIVKRGSLKDLILSNLWLLMSALSGVMLVLQKSFLNNAQEAYGNIEGALHSAIVSLVILMALKAAEATANVFSGDSSRRMWTVLRNDIESDMLSKSYSIKVKYFEDPETYNLFERAKYGSPKIIDAVTSSFGLFGALFSLTSAIFAMLSDNWMIMLIAVAGCIPLLASQVFIGRMNYKKALWDAPVQRKQGYMYCFMTSKGYINEMRMLGFFPFMKKRYDDTVHEYIQYNDRVAAKFAALNIISAVFRYGILGVALWMTVQNMLHNQALIGSFALTYGAITGIQGNSVNLFKNLAAIREDTLFVNDYIDMMSLEDEDLKRIDEPVPEKMEIKFDHVTFRYPGSDRDILKDFSVTFHDGEKVAIVGENGAGKSTFVALLLGLYEPQKGTITFNGRPLKECLGLARRSVSCALQKRGFYEMTMEENVRIGDGFRKNIPHSEIVEASVKTGFDAPVRKMKDGYNSLFGYRMGASYDLSGGEGQKLINARALLKKDARYLVLDEPTAALDPVAEAQVYKNFNELTGNKACLLISHRLGIATVVDRVIVVDDGRVVEDGTHNELLAENGLYAKMWNSQAKWYVS